MTDQGQFGCLDCGVDTMEIGHYPYTCPDDAWLVAVPDGRGMLCLYCLGMRLDAAGLPWPWDQPVAGVMAGIAATWVRYLAREPDLPT